MVTLVAMVTLVGFVSIYHQPRRIMLPTICFSSILMAHVVFCVMFWMRVLGMATSGTDVMVLLLYALGAPEGVLLLALLWAWRDAGWPSKPPRFVMFGLLAFFALHLVFTGLLGVLYSWQLATGLLLATCGLGAFAAAARLYVQNGGYLPRKWRLALSTLMVLVALAGVLISLFTPSAEAIAATGMSNATAQQLAAVNGFVGTSVSWWTLITVAVVIGIAWDGPIRGQATVYTHWPTVVPSFRIMGREKAAQRNDQSYVLFLVATIFAAGWASIASVTFVPAGLGMCVGSAIEIALASFTVTRAFAPLHTIGSLAKHISREVLVQASKAVSDTKGAKAADQAAGKAAAVGPSDAGADVASTMDRTLEALIPDSSQELALAQGELERARTDTSLLKGLACGEASDTAAAVRRAAAKELNRLDDAVRDEYAAQMARWAKFHGCVVMGAIDAKAAYERQLEKFISSKLAAREKDDTRLQRLKRLAEVRGRLQRLTPAQRILIEELARAEEQKREEERRLAELEAVKQERLVALQTKMREVAMGHKLAVTAFEKDWNSVLSDQRSALTPLKLPFEMKLIEGRRAASNVTGEMANLAKLAKLGRFDSPDTNMKAMAYVRGGARAALDAADGAEAKLVDVATQMVDVAAIRQLTEARLNASRDGGAGGDDNKGLPSISDLPLDLQQDTEMIDAHTQLVQSSQLHAAYTADVQTAYEAAKTELLARAKEIEQSLKQALRDLTSAVTALKADYEALSAAVRAAEVRLEKEAADKAAAEAERQRRILERKREQEERERKEREEEEAEKRRKEAEAAEKERKEAELKAMGDNARMLKSDVEPRLAACRKEGKPYVDRDFPPTDSVLPRDCFGKPWERADSLSTSMFGENGTPEPDQIKQGALGDCWFISALSILANRPGLIQAIFVTPEPMALHEGDSKAGSAGLYCVVRMPNRSTTSFHVCLRSPAHYLRFESQWTAALLQGRPVDEHRHRRLSAALVQKRTTPLCQVTQGRALGTSD